MNAELDQLRETLTRLKKAGIMDKAKVAEQAIGNALGAMESMQAQIDDLKREMQAWVK